MASSTAVPAAVAPLLPVVSPVPADIEIAQSIAPKHISLIAEGGLGLLPGEYELHGPSKAKVCGIGAAASSSGGGAWEARCVRSHGAERKPVLYMLLMRGTIASCTESSNVG